MYIQKMINKVSQRTIVYVFTPINGYVKYILIKGLREDLNFYLIIKLNNTVLGNLH